MRISIHFSLASAKTSDLPIRMRVSYDGLRLDLRTGFVCPPDKWDDAAMRMRAGSVNRYGEKASTINRALSAMEAALGDILARYDIEHTVPQPAVLKADFEKALGRKPKGGAALPGTSLIDTYRRFMCEHGREISAGTVDGYNNVLGHLSDFAWADNNPDQLTQHDLSDFILALHEEGIENQTVSVYVTKIKAMLRWARREGLYHGTLPEDFQPKLRGLGKKDVHFLEWEEFEKILYVRLDLPAHEAVRDAFCFCCATGLRVSDCTKLRWQDVNLTSDTPSISILIKKTTKPITIELNKWSRAILDRQATRGMDPRATVFPVISLSSRNRMLPVIARLAGISGQVRQLSFIGNRCTEQMVDKCDAISTHWARHTFVVHALHLGISPEVITAWTGHASIESLKPYIAISDQTKVKNMQLFDE